MQEPSALGRAIPLVRDLRNRCPWDGAQTAETLRPYLVEEALELDHALGQGDPATVRDELGDVLLQVIFHARVAEERGAFSFAEVAAGLLKLIPVAGQKIYRELGRIYRRDRYLSLPAKAFIEGVREATQASISGAATKTTAR